MKNIIFLILMLFLSSAALAAGTWKTIVNENIYPNVPFFREIRIPNTEEYSFVRIYVGTGSLRVQNATVLNDNLLQLPLWGIQGDYRSPRTAEASFTRSKLRSIRLDLRSLDTRVPARVQISIR